MEKNAHQASSNAALTKDSDAKTLIIPIHGARRFVVMEL
jgi:hypothetical protein